MASGPEFDPTASDTDLPETLYHYTDINGVQGIWEKGELWLTHSLFLNDTSELQLGTGIVENVINANIISLGMVLSDAAISGSPLRDIYDEPEMAELKDISSAIRYAKGLDTFIACLTEQGDQLSQWRGYAREGYCVGLKTSALLDHCGDNLLIRRVRYSGDTDEQYANRTIEAVKTLRSWMLSESERWEDVAVKFVIANHVMFDASFIKDSSFAEEKEVRIVRVSGTPNHFTPNRYGMVPRIKIPIPSDSIVSVRVGPSAHQELKQCSLVKYFLNVGFGGAALPPPRERAVPKVYLSRIPFRDW
jgi:Protein of unknown function (DUF2971)